MSVLTRRAIAPAEAEAHAPTTFHEAPAPTTDELASVRDLHVTFRRKGESVHALRGVDLSIRRGEILGLVGESGSGKSALSSTILGLLPRRPRPTISGEVLVEGVDMIDGPAEAQRRLRRDRLGAVFQDPMTSLNPVLRIGRQLVEATGSVDEAVRLLTAAGIPDPATRLDSYPHELSGGQRQRVMIAMAVAGRPSLVVADEPTTALDVTVQAQILVLLRRLRDEYGLSMVFITHDLAVAAQVSDRIGVMYAGRIVELGNTRDVLLTPTHPYTSALVNSRLTLSTPRNRPVPTLPGEPASTGVVANGCAFRPRCGMASDTCADAPAMRTLESVVREVACHHPRVGKEALARPAALPSPIRRPSTEIVRRPERQLSTPPQPAIEALDVRKTYLMRGNDGKRTVTALDGVSLAIQPGESVAVVGESGSGKSTLLRVFAGLLAPDSGEVALAPREQPQMVFQDAGASLTPWLTVGDIVSERLRAHGMSRKQRRTRIREALQLVGAPAELSDARAGELSGGQRQRVAIARAIAVAPAVLLCDEPTSALDVSLAATVLNLLTDLRHELGMSIVFVTHDLAAARIVADRIAVMNRGSLVEVGPVDEVCAHPSMDYTRTLLEAMPDLPTK
jgi:peptide/nickel transport system ATP-binding protein